MPPHRSSRPQVVVVTGASAGVGRATATEFAARGATVALLARGEKGLQGAADDVRAAGGTPLVVPVDVADADAVEAAAARVEDEAGEVDVWVNDAFSSIFAPLHEISAAEFRRATEVTYLGTVHGTMAALSRMRARDRGTIVQVGSALAYRGIPLQSAYCGAKHAIQGFTESLRCELLHDRSGVRVTMVQLPGLNTPQFSWLASRLPNRAQPVAPIYEPSLAARSVVWAADHPQRREHWVGTATVGTLLGNAVAPGLLDRYLGRTGYDGQQRDEPRSPDDAQNLWEPADGPDGRDYGTSGVFGDQALSRDPQVWLSHHRWSVLAAATAAAAGAAAVLGRSR